MNETDYNARLYEKMKAEQDKYRDWLLHQEPPEILNHTYEYTMREDIVMCMEELELEPEKARALLRSPCPLCVVYKEFRDRETEQMPCSTWTKRRMRSWTASEARRSRRKRPWQESVKKAKSQRQCRTSALPL